MWSISRSGPEQMDKTLPIARFYDLLTFGEDSKLTWATAPRAFFASNRDHRRWNERFAGKPPDQGRRAFRIRVIEKAHAKKQWRAHVVVGAQRFSLSSYNDRKAARLDANKLLAIQALSRGFGLRRVRAQPATLQSGPIGYSALRPRGTGSRPATPIEAASGHQAADRGSRR